MTHFAPGARFSKVPKLFGRVSGVLCIFKTKASRGTKLCSYLNFCSLCNILKDQLFRISGSDFYEWLFGPEKFSELSRNGSLIVRAIDQLAYKTYVQARIADNANYAPSVLYC